MSSEELIKKHREQRFESEVGTIEYRLVESMSFLDLQGDDMTNKLYSALDKALTELQTVKEHIKNGTRPFKLPEGYRAKMEDSLIEALAEGRDYSDYIYESAQNEVHNMDDEEFFDEYEAIFYDEDGDYHEEENKIINTIQDILDKEKLEEVINE